MGYLNNRIARDIEKGGIIFAPRRSGKTLAILCVLTKSKDYVLICPNPDMAMAIISELHRKGIPYKDCRKMVKGPRSNIPKGKKIIIDEFMWNPFFFKSSKINFHAAVSSSALSTILYNKKGRRLVLEKEDILEK